VTGHDLSHQSTHGGRACRIDLAGPGAVPRFTPALVAALRQQLLDCANHGTEVLSITGSTRAFCAGIDLHHVHSSTDTEIRRYLLDIDRLLRLMSNLPYLTIATLSGPAFGAGADLAVACDLRLAAPEVSLRFPGAGFGLVLGTDRAAQVFGAALTLELYTSGRPISAHECELRGAVNAVVELENLSEHLEARVGRMLALPPKTIALLVDAVRGHGITATATSIDARELPDRVRAFAGKATRRDNNGHTSTAIEGVRS
jgi:enoyl-CoA hydratase